MIKLDGEQSPALADCIRGYITCALWSSTGDDDEPLDKNYTVKDLAPETLKRVAQDCACFLIQNALDIWQAVPIFNRISNGTPGMEHVGHDLWLTRNGHGAGFWDGDLPDELGERLSEAARKMGQCDLYVGDDGKLYI